MDRVAPAQKSRLSIRANTYRGVPGFSIYGTDAGGRRIKVFAETRAAAEHIREVYRGGESPRYADWFYGTDRYEVELARVPLVRA